MVCTLTDKQQRLFLGKVAIDLKNMKAFDMKSYAKTFYDLVLSKSNDPILAANYVAMLPTNVRAVNNASKEIFAKVAPLAGEIVTLETKFEDFANVEKYIADFANEHKQLAQLGQTLQQASLTNPPQQKQEENPEPLDVSEGIVLSDVNNFDNDKTGALIPGMEIYADAKAEMIANRQPDGTSLIQGERVRLTLMTAEDFKDGDFYPEPATKKYVAENPKEAHEGIVLVVTDLEGKPRRFDRTLQPSSEGKIIYYNIRKPVGETLKPADLALMSRVQKQQNITQAEAEQIVRKKLNFITKVREYITKTKKKLFVNITGGSLNYTGQITKNKSSLGALKLDGPFQPYKGIKSKGQKENVYYFNIPGTDKFIPIDSPSIPTEIVDKLVQLLTEDLVVKQGSKSFTYSAAEKIGLFNQLIYVDKDVFDLTTDQDGDLLIKKLGVEQRYDSKELMAEAIREVLTRKVPVRKLSQEQAKGKTRAVNLKTAMYGQVWEQVMPNGNVNYYEISQVQLKVNDTAYKNNLFQDFEITGDHIKVEPKPYFPFIQKHFLIPYQVDVTGKFQSVGSTIDFQIAPHDMVQMVKPSAKKINVTVSPEMAAEAARIASESNAEYKKANEKAVAKKLSPEEKLIAKNKQIIAETPIPEQVKQEEKKIDVVIEKEVTVQEVAQIAKEENIDESEVKIKIKQEVTNSIRNIKPKTKLGVALQNVINKILKSLLIVGLIINMSFINAPNISVKILPVSKGVEMNVANESSYNQLTDDGKLAYDNEVKNKKSFIIVDKPLSKAYIYDSTGKLVKSFPVVLGRSLGDQTNAASASSTVPGDKAYTTAGKFTLDSTQMLPEDRAEYKNKILAISGTNELALHITYPGELEKRTKALNSDSVEDNRLSWGCVNISEANWDNFVKGNIEHGSKIIITRDFQKEGSLKLNKLGDQNNLKADVEQINAAEKWYNNHPLSKYFGFSEMFDAVNAERPNAVATWEVNGITLFKGSDYSDLYHEAWHGFTQTFLTHEQKQDLYNETRKIKGTFTDYVGKTVKFSEATELQLEEYLAEDFREYMLFNGETSIDGSPVRNSIFRRIYNFLRKLFGVNDNYQNVRSNKMVADLYNKMRVGDLSVYSFEAGNRNFDTLNKALTAINEKETQKSLSFENSQLIFDSVDSLFSQAIDAINQANVTSGYTTLMLSSVKGVTDLYDYVKDSFETRLEDLVAENEKNPSIDLESKIDLLKWSLRNFGDVEKLYNNTPDEGVIGYHRYKSQLIDDDFEDNLLSVQKHEELEADIEELTGRESEGKAFFERGGNEVSIFDLANREIRNLIRTLMKTDINGDPVINKLGFPQLVTYREAFAYIARTVQNSKDIEEMYQSLVAEKDIYPPIAQLLQKLGPLSFPGQSQREVQLWSKFFQTMNKYRVMMIQTTVNMQQDVNDMHSEQIFDIRIGNALSDYKRIDQDWRSEFAKDILNPMMRKDINGNYLDVTSVMEKYPTVEAAEKDPHAFLRDIGIKMKNIPIIKQEIEHQVDLGIIRLTGIYKNLQVLHGLNTKVRSLDYFLKHNPELGIVGQTGPKSNYGKILQLESKYNGEYSDFMVQNAEGEPQSEFSQNNSLTQIVKLINSAKSYNELVSNPATAHYNNAKNIAGRPYNPFINSSIWIRSLFDMASNGGVRYENKITIENLSGINSSFNDSFFETGVSASQADEVGKLLSDFHIQLMRFTPELTRHAGKKTSLAVSLDNYKTYGLKKNAKLYIDTEQFISRPDEFNHGFDQFYNILKDYITAELERVNYAKWMLTKSSVNESDFKYLERATKFVAFEGVLSQDTQNELYKLTGDTKAYLSSKEGVALNERMYDEVLKYFTGLSDSMARKISENEFISPSLMEKIKTDATKLGKKNVDERYLKRAMVSSFVANNWIHHFEEMIMLYGDIALYKDFFKRNASLNSTGDIIRNDAHFINYVNETLGKKFAEKLGVPDDVRVYNGIYNTAISDDVIIKSSYLDEYETVTGRKQPKYDERSEKNKDGGINEADAQGLITFDSYRIILDSMGKWTKAQEKAYQEILAGKPLWEIDSKNIFPVLKMGYFGPLQTEHLPMTALHKFALMPLIPGLSENLDNLHEKMMREGIDYHTFTSGSKVATITKKSGIEPFYKNVKTRELNDAPFVKNRIFSEYLKYQVEAKPKYKGTMTLPTQLRKLAELGLMGDNGVPTDYSGTKESWENMLETDKRHASKNYAMRQRYIRSLEKLVDFKKNELLSKIGWRRDKNGQLVGDMESLLHLVSGELKRGDVGDHEWAFIQTIKNGEIKNQLDISQSAEMIEKVITALVNKSLIDIKVNGEQLVMVSTTGFENRAFAYGTERNFEKPTDEEKLRYGSNDLPTYHIRNGKIAAAKVKIALQGKFELLLEHDDVKAKAKELGISKFAALNTLLKDDQWLDKDDNRAMISMVGARIPTQGPNSVDFVEVYEFLPKIAGNIVIAPSEVTSKGGSDFDYDKLPLMMPNIRINKATGKIELAKPVDEDEARKDYDYLIKKGIHKITFTGLEKEEFKMLLKTSDRFEKVDKIVATLFGPDYYEELARIVQDGGLKTFEQFFEKLNGTAAIENEMQQSLRAIFERPENLADLIRPNDTDLVKPFADIIFEMENKGKPKGYYKQGTRMFEIEHNLKVQQANMVGKDALGIGAIFNTFNSVFGGVGLVLNDQYGRSAKSIRRAKLLLPYVKTGDGISLSNTKDALNENNVADIISQLINGWVDVEKDDWISYIQGNKELAPVILFMVQAGVPIRDVIYFVTQPLVRMYVKEQRIVKGSFAEALGREGSATPKATAKNNILFDHFEIPIGTPSKEIYQETLYRTQNIKEFDKKQMAQAMQDYIAQGTKYILTDFDRAAFLHFLEVENMTREINKVTRAFNVDTTKLQSITEYYAKISEIEELGDGFPLVPKKAIEKIKTNSPIGPFYVQDFAIEVFGRLMPLRNKKVLNNYLDELTKMSEDPHPMRKVIGEMFGINDQDGRLKFFRTFKNDLISYIFQKELRSFTHEQGWEVSNPESAAPVQEDIFINAMERDHFLFERERLREAQPFNSISGSIEFKEYMIANEQLDGQRLNDESIEDFVKRMEEKSYEEWLRDTALYNIFNPYMLFKSDNNVADKFNRIAELYPALKGHFSFLNNVKTTMKDGFENIQPVTLKFNKDEINVFHENFQDLGNSAKLVGIKGITQRDADYIAAFFNKLPLYLYLQSGSNTRNAFSFARMMPNEQILRILEQPIKEVTETIDEKYLDEFLNQFIYANSQFTTRNRFKEFLKPMQLNLFKNQQSAPAAAVVSADHKMSYSMPAKDNLTGKDTSTIELAEQGLRTATTRSFALGKVGDVITFEGRPQKYRITGVEELTEKNTTDPVWVKQWSEKEQWTEGYYYSILNKKNTVKVGSFQTSFEKIGDKTSPVEKVVIQDGLEVMRGGLTAADQQVIFDFVKPIIEKHSYNPFPQYTMASAGRYEWSPEEIIDKEGKSAIRAGESIERGIISFKKKQTGTDGNAPRWTYHYYANNVDGTPVTPIPENVLSVIERVVGQNMTDYDTVLINVYPIGRTLGWHTDVTEDYRNMDRDIISVSLGADADFLYSNTPDSFISGNPTEKFGSNKISLKGGDVVVFGGKSRLMTHTVENITGQSNLPPLDLSDSNVNTGFKGGLKLNNYRINLTFRVAAPQNNSGKRGLAQPMTEPTGPLKSMSEIVNHSGGAIGSDSEWDTIGKEFGVTDHRHYYHGEKTPKGNVALTDAQLEEGWQHVLKANETLKRKPQAYKSLLSRNWYQVKNADEVFAIGTFQDGPKSMIVNGGTSWAVQMALDNNKTVYFFDQDLSKWFILDKKLSERPIEMEGGPSITTKNFAGIGTRKLNPAGKAAIREVYQNTFEDLSEKTTEVTPTTPKLISNEELNEKMNCKK